MVLALTLAACGESTDDPDAAPTTSASEGEHSEHTPSASASPSASPSEEPSGTAIDVTFEGGTVTPSGEVRQAEVGEGVTLRITADAPGELHIHSTPEQEVPYDAGTSTVTLTFDRPGSVDVESHDLGIIIVKLEVR